MKIGKDGWLELDPAIDMDDAQRAAFNAYKEAYAIAKEYRASYEQLMNAAAPQGYGYVFGYNFGKASVKRVRAGELKAPKVAKPQMTLADYNAAADNGGHSR